MPENYPIREMTPLLEALMRDNSDYVLNNTLSKSDLTTTFTGNTLLIWGIASSAINATLALLNKPGITIDYINTPSVHYTKATPLILSMSKGFTHTNTAMGRSEPQFLIAKRLLELGADVNALDIHGRSALHYACLHRDIEAINTLIEYGADWTIADEGGFTPLHFCFHTRKTALVILSESSGGREDYTFTLNHDNFKNNEVFLNQMLAIVSEFDQAVLFKQHQRLNSKYQFIGNINDILKPLHEHTDALKKIKTSKATEKAEGLTTLCKEIIQLAKNITLSDKNINSHFQPEQIEIKKILEASLKNPILIKERDLIRRTGLFILNALALLCGVSLVKYTLTGTFFFSHKTKTEHLLTNAATLLSQP